MIKKLILGLVSLGAMVLSGCGITTSAVDYNNALVDLTDPMYDIYNEYSVYAEETSLAYAPKIEEQRQSALTNLLSLRETLVDYDSYKGDSSLQEGFLADLDTVIGVLGSEDKGLVALWIEISDIPNDDWTEAMESSYTEKENALLESANNKLQLSGEMLTKIQETFAAKHDFDLAGE